MDRQIYRGDDYPVYRAVFRYKLVTPETTGDPPEPVPFNMANCTIRATFKETPIPHLTDPDDVSGYMLAEITFGPDGSVSGTPELFSLPDGVSAAAGILHLTVDRATTKSMPVGMVLNSDVQVTDALGNISTMPALVTLVATDSYTNRGE